ncbi:hypothetical protein JCM8097_004144 [Rhodosporidiobolus ruineniae]
MSLTPASSVAALAGRYLPLVATVGLGVSAGTMGAFPVLLIPALFDAPTSHEARLVRLSAFFGPLSKLIDRVASSQRTWSAFYGRISAFMKKLVGVLFVCLVTSAWLVDEVSPGLRSKKRALLLAAAFSTFLVAPYTELFIEPLNRQLHATLAVLNKRDSVPPPPLPLKPDSAPLVPLPADAAAALLAGKYRSLYFVKPALAMVALAMVALGLVMWEGMVA